MVYSPIFPPFTAKNFLNSLFNGLVSNLKEQKIVLMPFLWGLLADTCVFENILKRKG